MSFANKAILCSYGEVYKAGVICVQLNIIMQKFSLPNVLTYNAMTFLHLYMCIAKRPDSTLFLVFLHSVYLP